jgi:NAD(P)-dependent dehydrogenase (short-subunit alcohol dehydrogenase family)
MMGLLELASLDDARRQLEVNTLGPMRLIQLVTPDMRAVGRGRIINVSSIVARVVIPFGGWYSASKFALEALNDAMRLELHPFGIRVVSVLPGPVKTDFVQNIVLCTRDNPKPELYRRAEQAYVGFRKRKRPFEISADDVAKVIVRAAETENPRPRYYLTLPAKISAFGRRFLTDRAVDRVLRAVYGISKLAREGEIS